MSEIIKNRFYKTHEIAEMGLLSKAKSQNVRHQMILRFIRQGRIKGINVGNAVQPRYVVEGKTLLEYMNRAIKCGECNGNGYITR